MRTAYAASRFRAQHANAASRPYFQYLSMDDDRVRPSHRAMSGRVYRHDDPIWDTHYPPNGFNCRCTVRALTPRQVRSRSLGVYRTGTADGGVLRRTEQVVGVDRRTGEEIRRPATEYVFEAGAGRLVTLTPDPGWNYNPGRTGAPFGPITGDPTRLRPLASGRTTARQLDLPALPRLRPPPPLPPVRTAEAAEEQIRRAIDGRAGRIVRLDDGSGTTEYAVVLTPAGPVTLTGGFIQHVARRRARDRFARQIVPTLSDPFEVWLQPTVRPDGRLTYEPVYIGDHGDYVVAQEHRDGTVGWTFYRPSNVDSRRRGYLLYRR